jgi:hypothetical protein
VPSTSDLPYQLLVRFRRRLWASSLLFGGLMTAYYWYIILVENVPTDIQIHLQYLAQQVCTDHQTIPANGGFYLVVWLLAGFSCNYTLLSKIAVVFLGACWGTAVYLSGLVGAQIICGRATATLSASKAATVLVAAITSCLVFPVLVSRSPFYIGLIPPNVYHNSTWISALPWVIAVFGLGLRQLQGEAKSLRTEAYIGVLLLVGAFFKPSFAFVFIPTYALLRVSQLPWHRWHTLVLPLGIALLPVVLLVVGQVVWLALYSQTTLGEKIHLALAFPAGWRYAMPHLPWSRALLRFCSSFALPALAYYLRPDWLKRVPHQFSLLCAGIGFLLFMLVYETGVRAKHGNFLWQCFYANHLLYWMIILSALNWQPSSASEYSRRNFLWAAIGLNLVSGLLYLTILVVTKSFF